jgi:hypothetical protein
MVVNLPSLRLQSYGVDVCNDPSVVRRRLQRDLAHRLLLTLALMHIITINRLITALPQTLQQHQKPLKVSKSQSHVKTLAARGDNFHLEACDLILCELHV